jgi:V/A-type H+-transporting ATPase subunit E
MGTDELRKAVLQEATAEATALIDAATAKASEAVETQNRQLEEQAEKRVAEHRAMRDRDIVNRTAALKIELRNALLQRKQQLLDDLYQEAKRAVQGDESLYRAYLKQALDQLGQTVPVSIECTARDQGPVRDILKDRVEWANVRIDAALADNEGGLIARFAEGDLDLTLSAAIGALRENTVLEVAPVLFGDKR